MSMLDPRGELGVIRRFSATYLTADRRRFWLLPGLLAGVAVYVAYVLTHPYPAFGAGLFLAMGERVAELGYRLPATVPGYTVDGIPFAYPPLAFYLVAAIRDLTGLSPITVGRFLPGVFVIAYLVPLYLFARDTLPTPRQAGLATLLVAVAPHVLQWHISAGGFVRSLACLFLFAGLYTGRRLFVTGKPEWIPPSLALFGLTVLTHPVYTAFFALTYLWMFAVYDRSLRGLRAGAVVGVGGLLAASPWWVQVLRTHGVDVFAGAAGTHGGIGKRIPQLARLLVTDAGPASPRGVLFSVSPELFNFYSPGTSLVAAWFLAGALAVGWLAVRKRRAFIPGMLLLSLGIVSKPRFSVFVGSLALPVFLLGGVVPAVRGQLPAGLDTPGRGRLLVAVLLAVAATATGLAYATSNLDSHAGSRSLPAFIDDADREAMTWVADSTAPNARFVVFGDAAEWFPLLTDRSILVGPWGVEWRGQASYSNQLRLFNRLSTCRTESCVTRYLIESNTYPDYIYVPKGSYTVRGMEETQSPTLVAELQRSMRYELVYENRGVAVFSVNR